MNEKIKQMIDDRGMFHQSELYEIAEAVIRECLLVINQPNGVGDDDVIRISDDVKKHFGVK